MNMMTRLLSCCAFLVVYGVSVQIVRAETCDLSFRVGDATGRPLSTLSVGVNDKMCVFADAGIVAPCIATTNDDGVVRFTMDRGLTPPDVRVTERVHIDPDILNVVVDVGVACGDEHDVRLPGVYRSGRGRLVVRSPLKGDEGCGNVLLVHGMKAVGQDRCGYGGGGGTWCNTAKLFTDAGYGVAEYLYPTDGRVQVSAVRLASTLRRIENITGNTEWFVVAHSFGGLVVRECMSGGEARCAPHVRTLVTLGTPHEGVSWWCAVFSCKPRVQLVAGSAYLVGLASRPLLMTPVTVVAGTSRMPISCTSALGESDGIVTTASALPESFAGTYTTQKIPLNHLELSCMNNDAHKSFQIAMTAFADAGGCARPCVSHEHECGKGFDACCTDRSDNDCDGRIDFFDIDCFDDGNGEF